MTFVHYRTKGFIFKKNTRFEADILFTIFTYDFGRIEVVGRAIRKITSKLRAGAELFYLSEIEFIQGKIHKTLTDVVVLEKFKDIRKDIEKLKIAYQIAEVLDNLIKGQEKDEKVWNLLYEVFEKLNNCKLPPTLRADRPGGKIEKQPFGESRTSCGPALKIGNWKSEIIYYYFLWNLLAILGYQINLYNCAFCQKKLLPKKLFFSPKEKGIVCFQCFGQTKENEQVSLDIIKILRIFLKKDWSLLSRLKIENCHKNSLESISQTYLDFINH